MSVKFRLSCFIVVVPFLWVFAGDLSAINFLESYEGQETAGFIPIEKDRSNFTPYSEAFERTGRFLRMKVPKSDGEIEYRVTGLKKISVTPGMRYSIKMKAMGTENIYLLVMGLFYKNDEFVEISTLVRNTYFLNVNGMVAIEKEFAPPPDTDSMILYMALIQKPSGKTLTPGTKLVFEELSVSETGPMKTVPADMLNKNFLKYDDFTQCALGEFTDMTRGLGERSKRWSNVDAQVVELEGEKCLRIIRTPENFSSPFFKTAAFGFDPQTYYIKATATVRGEGEFHLGLWWIRDGFNTDFQNQVPCILSDEWTSVTEIRPCLSPLVLSTELVFHSNKDGVLYVKNLSVEIVNAED